MVGEVHSFTFIGGQYGARICLVSCVSEKLNHAVPAAELYTSDLFKKARRYATERADRWFILSAEHGLLKPDVVTAPYNKTLNDMPLNERRQWADGVLKSLLEELSPGDEVTFLAGDHYREYLTPGLEARKFLVHVPMKGLRIGEQLHWLNSLHSRDVERFYDLLDELGRRIGGPRELRNCRGKDKWPTRGVYFFFEPNEMRAGKPLRHRVVRVGTHAITEGGRSTLWGRLRQHRGGRDGGGNHRGSVFRRHIGAAILSRDRLGEPTTWGDGKNATRAVKDLEVNVEHRVSEFLGQMNVLWLPVDDQPSRISDRAIIERNAIGMLTAPKALIDPPSESWLGRHSVADEIRAGGLWNVNHVGEDYSPSFLDVLERRISSVAG